MFKRGLLSASADGGVPVLSPLRRAEGRRRADGRRGAPKTAATTAAAAPRLRRPLRLRPPAARRSRARSTSTGAAPAMAQIKMDADAYCKAEHKEPVYEQEVVVNPNKTLRVGARLRQGRRHRDLSGADRAPVTLDQHGCQYRPHVFGIQAGQPLKILNSDGTLHNIHALPKKNAEFNIGQPFKRHGDAQEVRQRRGAASASSATCTSGWAPTRASSTTPSSP